MALVVLLKGINVGGHRRFRPRVLADDLQHFDVVNIGATGTLVVRKRVSRATLRDAILRHVPFDVDVMICDGREVLRLVASDPFADHTASVAIIPFVSLLDKRPRRVSTPLTLPSGTPWSVKVLECRGRFVLGLYRREMKSIGYLSRLDAVFGSPAATRNWNTVQAVARILSDSVPRRETRRRKAHRHSVAI